MRLSARVAALLSRRSCLHLNLLFVTLTDHEACQVIRNWKRNVWSRERIQLPMGGIGNLHSPRLFYDLVDQLSCALEFFWRSFNEHVAFVDVRDFLLSHLDLSTRLVLQLSNSLATLSNNETHVLVGNSYYVCL